jgi:hypothetical protein
VKSTSDLASNESDGALIVTEAAAREKSAQVQAERAAVVKPPVERFAARVDAIASAELD